MLGLAGPAPWQVTRKRHCNCLVSAGEVAVKLSNGYIIRYRDIVVNDGWLSGRCDASEWVPAAQCAREEGGGILVYVKELNTRASHLALLLPAVLLLPCRRSTRAP